METKEKITWIICVTIAFLAVMFVVWWLLASQHPYIFVMRMEMDNNTLEAMKAVNYTILQ